MTNNSLRHCEAPQVLWQSHNIQKAETVLQQASCDEIASPLQGSQWRIIYVTLNEVKSLSLKWVTIQQWR